MEHFWCTNEPRANTDSQNSPRPGLGRNHHLSFYNILCAWPWGLQPNVILSWNFQVESPKIPKIWISTTLEAHNFLCKPLIEVRSKVKLCPLLRYFQWYVAHHLHASKSRRFLTFNGRESNWQFNSWLFFWP